MERDVRIDRRLPRPSAGMGRPKPRYEPPRATLHGGDRLRGGNPCAPGHAGRRGLSWVTGQSERRRRVPGDRRRIPALLTTIVLVLSQVLGMFSCAPTTAFAASGTDPMTVTLDNGTRHELDGTAAYCCDPVLTSPPKGSVLTHWVSGSLALDFALYHAAGGPGNHYGWWATDRYAIWAIICNDTSYLTTITTGEKMDDDFSAQATALYNAAMAYQRAGGGGPEQGCSRIYDPPTSQYQRLAVCVPQWGSLALAKRSALPGVTTGDPCYSLEGAEYTVYRDATCTVPVTTMVTDADGKAESILIAAGDYWVRETKAPQGYALDETTYATTVEAAKSTYLTGKTLPEMPLYASVGALVRKGDAQMLELGATGQAQGDATLAGALFAVERHADTLGNTGGEAVRSWVIGTDESGLAYLDDEHLVEGDEPYRDADGAVVLPLGTYTMREVAAPGGYLLSDTEPRTFVVVQEGSQAVVRPLDGTTSSWAADALAGIGDDVVRGGVRVGKVDAQRGDSVAQGAATLAGATVAIELVSDQPVVVNGTTYTKGQVVTTLSIGADGTAMTEADALPFGTYEVYEAAAPEGYLLTRRGTWSRRFEVREQGVIVDLTEQGGLLPEQVKRGDLAFVKVDGLTMRRMGGIPFAIESLTTGERHVVVSDENGNVSTEAAAVPHTAGTNANDVLLAEGADPELEGDPAAGVWFSGGTDMEVAPNDLLGALPYDTYRVSELRAPANEGYQLVSFEVRVSRDLWVVDGGTVDDLPAPTLQTRLAVAETTDDADVWELVDTVYFGNVLADGTTYEVRGSLHLVGADGSDAGIIAGPDGETLEASVAFEPMATSGTVEVPFTVDVRQLRGQRVVAFEELWCDGELVAEHADISDAEQTVSVPRINTMLTDEAGLKEVDGSAEVALIDEVHYEGLVPGKAYTVTGTLMDRESGEPLLDAQGLPITAEASVIPEEPSGSAFVTFTFDGSACRGGTVVAFEELWQEGLELAVHASLEDEAQTVTVPEVRTHAADAADGDHELLASGEARIVDTVTYRNLRPGAEYVVLGSLVYRQSGEPVLVGGEEVTAQAAFTPEEPDGSVEVTFAFDATELAGSELTVFETLCHGDVVVATHHDPTSEEQSLRVPRMGTTAESEAGAKVVPAKEGQILVDTIAYEGLTPGREYTASGTIHLRGKDGSDEGALTDAEGKPVAASVTFTPEQASGKVEVRFTVDASMLAERELVAFELLMATDNEGTVATHEDISDGGQTITVDKLPEEPETPPKRPTRTLLPQTGDLGFPLRAFGAAATLALGLGVLMRRLDLDDERRERE